MRLKDVRKRKRLKTGIDFENCGQKQYENKIIDKREIESNGVEPYLIFSNVKKKFENQFI